MEFHDFLDSSQRSRTEECVKRLEALGYGFISKGTSYLHGTPHYNCLFYDGKYLKVTTIPRWAKIQFLPFQFQNLIRKVILNIETLDERIINRVTNWEMNRIALIDKILLRIGICEILHFPDIPPKVSINECIEIAKDFSTAGSAKFINGILDAILAEEKKTGKLNKSGRGLIEESISSSRQ